MTIKNNDTKTEILAVHKQKLDDFLKKLGLWESLSNGELKCLICDATITKDNIGFIIPSGEEIQFCCFNIKCIQKLTQKNVEIENEL